MKKTELEEAKFLLVSRDPTKTPSMELIWKRSKNSVTTINVATFLEVTYEIRITKKGDVIFPNIPEVRQGDHQDLFTVQDEIAERRRGLTRELNEKREAHEKTLAVVKEFEIFCEKLSEKLPHYFKD
jgi:hypothetical protein